MENSSSGNNQSLQPLKIGDNGLFIMRDQIDVQRVARHLLETGAVPKSLSNPQQVAMAVQGLNSLGLNPYAAIRQIAFINGAMTIWGDLPLALARKNGLVEDFEEFRFTISPRGSYVRQCFENSNAHLETHGVVCRVKRTGQKIHEVVYTQEDARKSGLWNKTPTWQRFPARMMQMRARSQALKDVFSDALAGVQIQEFDVEGIASHAPQPASENHAPAGLVVEHVDSAPRRRGRPPAANRAEDAALKFVEAVAAGRNHEPPTQERQRHEAASFVDDDLDGLESTDHLHDQSADDDHGHEPEVELTRTQRLTKKVNAARSRL